ncbi:MAG: hypothetical protein JWO71_3384 [Candidatus Acidoferrum typicum]|nr:hypothetical protein [Candidatus Acidoferrum typicum]
MSARLITRVGLKIKKIARDLTESAEEREWRKIWQLVDSVEGWLSHREGKWLFNAARSLANGTNIVDRKF